MKIAVIGANGKQGSLLVKEAISRGHNVVAIVRGENKSETKQVMKKDLFDLTYQDVQDFDVIIDALGVWKEGDLPLHKKSMEHLTRILKGKRNRLLVVGGAGSLYINSEHNQRLMDVPNFPVEYKSVASNMATALDYLRQCINVQWTYLSPGRFYI